jgi:hypothetical protein
MYWQKLPASLAQISATGGKRVLGTQNTYTVQTFLADSFWVLRQNLQQVTPNQEKPHTTPFHYLIYSIYISVGMGLLQEYQAMPSLPDVAHDGVLCTFSNRSPPERGKWCGPSVQASWTVHHIQNHTLLGHSPPASQSAVLGQPSSIFFGLIVMKQTYLNARYTVYWIIILGQHLWML